MNRLSFSGACGTWALLLALAVPATALGQEPAKSAGQEAAALGATLTGQALVEYNAARLLYQNSDFAGALVKFQRAYELSRDPRLLWNMAACEKNLRRYARMLRLIERYEKEGGARSEQDREQARQLVGTVRLLVSNVRVVVNEPDASVFVDDELVGKTPLTEPVLVDLGTHRIRVSKPGYEEATLVQEISGASEMTLSFALERRVQQARLIVVARGAEAISIDGVVVGQSRYENRIATGRHVVRVTAGSAKPYVTEIQLRDGEVRRLDVSLQEKSGGGLTALWIGGSIAAAAGLGVGAYFLFRPSETTASPTIGTLGTVNLP
jgi:hypothetical protein